MWVWVCDLMSVQVAAAQHCTCLFEDLVNLVHQHGVKRREVVACTQQEQGHQIGWHHIHSCLCVCVL